MAIKHKLRVVRNVFLILIGLFLVFSVIAHFLPPPPARKTLSRTQQSESIEAIDKSPKTARSLFYSILIDANFPKMYESTREDFIAYFDKIKHKNWLNYNYANNQETSHFYITENQAGIVYEKHIISISITDKQGEDFSAMTLFEAIELGERFLPSTLPPVKKNNTTKIPDRITLIKTLEKLYFIPGDDYLGTENEIIYTSKFLSNEQSRDFNTFSTAIRIIINNGRIQSITIGGMQYAPPRLQKTYSLKLEVITDYESIIGILSDSIELERFIE
jgi:hypothetical protein